MSSEKYATFRLTFEAITPSDLEAKRKADEEAFYKNEQNQSNEADDQIRSDLI